MYKANLNSNHLRHLPPVNSSQSWLEPAQNISKMSYESDDSESTKIVSNKRGRERDETSPPPKKKQKNLNVEYRTLIKPRVDAFHKILKKHIENGGKVCQGPLDENENRCTSTRNLNFYTVHHGAYFKVKRKTKEIETYPVSHDTINLYWGPKMLLENNRTYTDFLRDNCKFLCFDCYRLGKVDIESRKANALKELKQKLGSGNG